MTTNATPEEILGLFPDAFYDNKFGTVGIPLDKFVPENKNILEITTYRTEHSYKDNRHPEKIEWGKTLNEDVERRDFTINALAMSISFSADDQQKSNNIIDLYQGQLDLENKIIRAVGDPNERFKEDALRLIRAIRFATQLGFQVEEKTLDAIIKDSSLLQNISGERIRDELLKILASDYPYEGVLLLKNTGLLQYILPELLEGIGVSRSDRDGIIL